MVSRYISETVNTEDCCSKAVHPTSEISYVGFISVRLHIELCGEEIHCSAWVQDLYQQYTVIKKEVCKVMRNRSEKHICSKVEYVPSALTNFQWPEIYV